MGLVVDSCHQDCQVRLYWFREVIEICDRALDTKPPMQVVLVVLNGCDCEELSMVGSVITLLKM